MVVQPFPWLKENPSTKKSSLYRKGLLHLPGIIKKLEPNEGKLPYSPSPTSWEPSELTGLMSGFSMSPLQAGKDKLQDVACPSVKQHSHTSAEKLLE